MPRPRPASPVFSLTRRGAVYCVQWQDSSWHRISARTSNVDEARRFLAALRAGYGTPAPPTVPTIGAILDGYAQDRADEVRSPTIGYHVATIKRMLGDLQADLLTKERVKAYWTSRRKEGRAGAPQQSTHQAISDGTIRRELGVLRAALAWAVREKWLVSAPHVVMPPSPPPRRRWLTETEADAVIDAAQAPHVALFVGLALYTAARRAAILELTWDRVDMHAGLIDLGPGHGNKRRAIVPISERLRPMLEAALEARTSEHVVEFRGGPVGTVKTGLAAAAKRAGVQGVTAHVFRHTAASWMMQRDVPIEQIAALLGDSVEMVRTVYAKFAPGYLADASAALSKRGKA